MRRNHSDGGGRTESSTELIARITAERQSRSSATTGRHHTPSAADTTVIGRVPPMTSRPVGDNTVIRRVPERPSGETTAIRRAGDTTAIERTGATTAINRVDDQVTEQVLDRPIEPADIEQDADQDIEQDLHEEPDTGRPAGRRRRRQAKPITRRLAPLAVGAAVMLLATSVATLVKPTEQDQVAAPELSGQVVENETPPPNYLDEVDPAPPPPAPTPEPTPVPAPAPEPPPAPKPDEGKQAANVFGWTKVTGDEFNGGMGPQWDAYDGEGHNGAGRRTPDAVSVEDGKLVIRGDSDGNTGGIAWDDGQEFGKWELRAKFPKGDEQYHPVLLLWPSAENWPEGGEVDFAETNSAAEDVMFFLHYSEDNDQVFDRKQIDITDWHNYAVEWVDGRITGYIDGEKWFESTDDETLPPGDMHLTIQLDYFPDEGDPKPSEMLVDFVRIYE